MTINNVAQQLAKRTEENDGIAPLSEQFLLGLEDDSKGHRHVSVYAEDDLIGLAAIDGQQAELFIAPEARGRGEGTALVDELLADGVTDFWAHGDHPAAQAIAKKKGFVKTRELLVMSTTTLPEHFDAPEGYEVRSLSELPDAQEEWLKVNNEAFSWHPEQGGWDMDRLTKAQQVSWFDPGDVLFLYDSQNDRIAGFHWLKRHSKTKGEVYVVGLGTDYRGRGLGQPLIQMGLHHLRGMEEVILYVEADNAPAVKAYEALGFSTIESHVVYSAS